MNRILASCIDVIKKEMMAHCQISLFNSLIIQGNTWVKERKEYGIKVTWNWFCLAVWPDTVTIKFTACVKHIIILLKYTITQLLSTDESSYRVKNHPKRVTHQLSCLASKELMIKYTLNAKCQMGRWWRGPSPSFTLRLTQTKWPFTPMLQAIIASPKLSIQVLHLPGHFQSGPSPLSWPGGQRSSAEDLIK